MNSRIQKMEERISSAEDTVEEIELSVKENIKFNESLTQNIQEILNTMKRKSKNRYRRMRSSNQKHIKYI